MKTPSEIGNHDGAEIDADLLAIIEARHHDPFAVLGRQHQGKSEIMRVLNPAAETVSVMETGHALSRLPGTDLFECRIDDKPVPEHYQINWTDRDGNVHQNYDPYCFKPQLADFDIHLFKEGKHWHLYRLLGAHPHAVENVKGIVFATWAPNASRVSVVGDFNRWDGRTHPMRCRGDSGVWELFIPGIEAGDCYKYEIRNRASGVILVKSDPYGQRFEVRPKTSSVVREETCYEWRDAPWMKQRKEGDWLHQPLSIYEVHLGSWQTNEQGQFLGYHQLADRLVKYVSEVGFTHIELLPVTEHPLDASWGYQTTGYFAPTSRHGEADDFRYFVDLCHLHGIGVLLDWVPAHFPKDSHALARFDGTAVYEHEDPRRGEHRDWGTLIYNYGRNEVKNFLLASAMFWLEEFHIDGLRVDAVASMLYLDYSREHGDWIPNQHGGNENLEAIDFLRDLNKITHQEHPGAVVIAEESTAWPQVTRPTWTGGLGFSMKWNMGWMHDTLSYLNHDPIHRMYHHDQLTFGLLYAFTENFVLPFSHDEVVHGKRSMLAKMPGDEWQRFANLRLLYTYMFTYPGKKLLFMGNDFAQDAEWNHARSLDWHLLQSPLHRGVSTLVGDLNRLYRNAKALHYHDFDSQGFEWIDCHDASQSVLSYLRKHEDQFILVALNFTPVPRHNYRIGVPKPGVYQEIINSDSTYYGGSNVGNGRVNSDDLAWMDRSYSINLTLPPLAALVFSFDSENAGPLVN